MWPDVINGLFEFLGAILILLNVKALIDDKEIKGVHWGPTVFFTSWGFWNLIYYPALDQWLSFAGGVALVLVNTWWLGLVIYYSNRKAVICDQGRSV